MKNVTFMLRLKEKQQNLAEFLGADYMERVDPSNQVGPAKWVDFRITVIDVPG